MAEIIKVALDKGLGTIARLVSKARKFKTTRTKLQSAIQNLVPLVDKMKQLEGEFDLGELQESQVLVNKYSNVPWWKCCWLPFYQDKLQEMYNKLEQSNQLMQSRILVTLLETAQSRGVGRQINGVFKTPIRPELTVGFDVPLKELRNRLLESGTSVSVLTGLPGSGKTTLATMLCWDKQVKDKFGENILFITVSKTPNLKTIVETLLQCYGRNFADLGDDLTVRQLKNLLQEIGKGPLLLVLDDVWSASESLIDHFQDHELPDYKILVTSRFNFHRFGTSVQLKPLSPEDAVTLFSHFTKVPETDDFVRKVARGCRGLPLALEVIGKSLHGQPPLVWQKIERQLSNGDQSVLASDFLLNKLKECLDDVLEDEPVIMECFMDLGLFHEDYMIPVRALLDMWIELYEEVKDDMGALTEVLGLTDRHLAELVYKGNRQVAVDADMSHSNYFLMQHDLLREVAIRQNNQGRFEQRKRLVIDLSGNNRPEWWEGQNQPVIARTLCIYTDETFTSDWSNMLRPNEAEVLVLNIRSREYTIPGFTEIMSKLKVLMVRNYGFHPSELNKFELLVSLPDLKRIRLEKVSVPCLCKFSNLQKLSLYMCNTRQAFESSSIQISDTLPNLKEMNIEYCNDLEKLPSDLCNITTMKKLSIISCHKLSALPREIGNLENLELLRLSSCTELLEIPESVGRLKRLSCLDISDCVKLNQLPRDIGDLLSLKKLHMWGCSRLNLLRQLPSSVENFQHLQHALYVTCDEDVVALWENFTSFPNLKIDTFKANVSLGWLRGYSSLD